MHVGFIGYNYVSGWPKDQFTKILSQLLVLQCQRWFLNIFCFKVLCLINLHLYGGLWRLSLIHVGVVGINLKEDHLRTFPPNLSQLTKQFQWRFVSIFPWCPMLKICRLMAAILNARWGHLIYFGGTLKNHASKVWFQLGNKFKKRWFS